MSHCLNSRSWGTDKRPLKPAYLQVTESIMSCHKIEQFPIKTINSCICSGELTMCSSMCNLTHFSHPMNRKLLSPGVRDPVRASDGLLPHPGVHPVVAYCDHLVGLLLAESRCHSCQGWARCDYRAHHDHANGVDQRSPAKDFLRQIHRRLFRCLLLHGFRFSARYGSEFHFMIS